MPLTHKRTPKLWITLVRATPNIVPEWKKERGALSGAIGRLRDRNSRHRAFGKSVHGDLLHIGTFVGTNCAKDATVWYRLLQDGQGCSCTCGSSVFRG